MATPQRLEHAGSGAFQLQASVDVPQKVCYAIFDYSHQVYCAVYDSPFQIHCAMFASPHQISHLGSPPLVHHHLCSHACSC